MARRKTKLEGEPVFFALLKGLSLPMPESEFRFAPPRRWRFDYAWPEHRVALEVEGGVFQGGRHTRGAGFLKDMEKYNEAAAKGWTVLRTVPRELCSAETMDLLQRVL